MNLCDVCIRKYSECMNEHENIPDVVYGNDEANTNDAVLECSWFIYKEAKDEKIDKLVAELNRLRPYADCYKRICKRLGIEKNVLGYIFKIEGELKRVKAELMKFQSDYTSLVMLFDKAEAELKAFKDGLPDVVTLTQILWDYFKGTELEKLMNGKVDCIDLAKAIATRIGTAKP